MRHVPAPLGDRRGAILMVSALVLLAVMVLGIGMLTNNHLKSTMAHNHKERVKSFYAADGLMTKLAQEIIDGRGTLYARDPGYEGEEIGATDITGGDTLAGDYLYVWGSGAGGIGGSADDCHVEYVEFEGDFDVSLNVVELRDSISTCPSPIAGIMVRDGLTAEARMLFWGASNGGGEFVMRRTAGGSDSSVSYGGFGIGTPLRVRRERNRMTVFRDAGVGWNDVVSVDLPMASHVYVGAAVTSGGAGTLCKARFRSPRGFPCVDTAMVGDYDVRSAVTHRYDGTYEIATTAFKLDAGGNVAFSSSLNQIVMPAIGAGWKTLVEDTIYVPVTYYDFHADRSNPEFQISGPDFGVNNVGSHRYYNLVLNDRLDANRKPIPTYDDALANTSFRDCILNTNKCATYDPTVFIKPAFWQNNACLAHCNQTVLWWLCPSGGCMDQVSEHDRNWFFSNEIDRWFRPNGAPGAVFDTISGRWEGLLWVDSLDGCVGPQQESMRQAGNYEFENVVIYDELAFARDTAINPRDKNTYVYGFECDEKNYPHCSETPPTTPWGTSPSWESLFHPLANRGWGYDGPYDSISGGEMWFKGYPYSTWGVYKDQNYAFTMEFHRKFVADTGKIFAFSGNDDVWVFIDDTLVMDLSGVHGAIVDTTHIDSLIDSGRLTRGTEYWFDFFYCERNGWGSNIRISTNLMWYDPGRSTQRRWKRDYGTLD